MKIVPATTNSGKIAEIKAVFDVAGIEWVTADEDPDWPQVEETGATFLENATIKATALADYFNLPALADDSGLEVAVLGGRPGIYSARYAGPNAVDADNISKLLKELETFPQVDRRARFVTAVVLVWPDRRSLSALGACSGSIISVPRGTGGFGYDPVFLPDGYEKTMAELTPGEKNRISHRGRALRALRRELDVALGQAGSPEGGIE